jgi:hypothetical protein
MSSIIYLLDSDVFIEGRKSFYPPDIFPSYWEWLKAQAHAGTIKTVVPCYDDLLAGNDGLAEWVHDNCPSDFVLPVDKDSALIEKYASLMEWAVGHTQFSDGAKAEFAAVSDAWLVAAAMVPSPNLVVVTRERFDPVVKRRIPIPNVCAEHDITCIPALEWMRALKAEF